MNQKGFANIVFVVIITVVLAGLVGYFAFVRKPEAPPVTPTPTSTTEETEEPIASLKKYSNSLLGIEFYYPKNFIPYLRDNEYIGDQSSRFTNGKDSYAPLYENSSFVVYLGIDIDGVDIDEVAEDSAYHKLQPFGEKPVINKLQIEGQDARLIIPSDSNYHEAELIVKLKNPVLVRDSYWRFLMIHASGDLSREVIKAISESLHFL